MALPLRDKVLEQQQTPVNIRSVHDGVLLTTTPSNSIDNEPYIAEALNRILVDYGVSVSVKDKAKMLLKYGFNPNVGTATTGFTLWYTGQDQPHETYAADNTNPIDTISSNNAGDTEVVSIEGHTMSGGNKTFIVQNATLNGQNKVPLATPLNRCTRVSHANQSAVNLVGEIYVYEDTAIGAGKPTDTTKIHLTVPAGRNQSQKASTSLSSVDYWIVTSYRSEVLEKSAAFADVALQIRDSGGVFKIIEDISTSTNNTGVFEFLPYLIVPANADVRLVAVADNVNRNIGGSIQGFLAN